MARIFGQALRKSKKGGGSRYQRQFGGKDRNGGTGHSHSKQEKSEEELLAERRAEYRRQRQHEGEQIDKSFGYERFDNTSGIPSKRGWIFNMLPTTISTAQGDAVEGGTTAGPECAGLDLYFLGDDGSTFKSLIYYSPYFYVMPEFPPYTEDPSLLLEALISNLMRLYEGLGLRSVELVNRMDLDQLNHLSSQNRDGRPMLKLVFDNVSQLVDVRKRVQEIIRKNTSNQQDDVTYAVYDPDYNDRQVEPLSTLVDIREYDVPYLVRVCTDLEIRAGSWYTVTPNSHNFGVTLSERDVETKAQPSYLAFDIECTKAPLKFPDANNDSIFMISYMVNGQGYLIISRHVVSRDVHDFEYTPKPSYPGPFRIFNEATEQDLLKRFFDEYRKHKPQIVVTYNGDFFDWPFVEQRAALYGLDIWKQLGVERQGESEYRGRCSVHLDAFNWVQRDSYLPAGSQGLKAVTKYKLGYNPVEVDPEDMVRFAQERPVHMATYSVSDAVATYYLYEKYVHMFIFSLATIIPMGPEDVLRKGSGTLCEALLMVQACNKSIICPNKQVDPLAKFHQGHLLEAETYIGGKVECLETGVYRSDVEYEFDLKPSAFQHLIDNIDRDLTFAIEVEGGQDKSRITNYDEIRNEIIGKLEKLRDRPKRKEKPYIYHLDVGAMYPNIILTNRLQPSAMVDDATCAACDFNQSKNNCKRRMEWVWRGDYNPATKNEYDRTKDQLSRESHRDGLSFHDLPEKEQAGLVAARLKDYSRNAYKKTKVTEEITRRDTVCMRENDFYVDTVRRFRDRRYELKKLTKVWKKKIGKAEDAGSKKEAADRALVYDSLQVAHKCILNSFYGYVMRKGARWRSMEMAGIVTKTGADLITQARKLVEQIGRPLELDTDGIWCILPVSFPDVYNFKISGGGTFKLEYPCVMLNADVHNNFTNHQYQTLNDEETGTYGSRSECSIFFEVDGPYRCMVLPASTEEGKLLKKRYAVFNFDGSLAELKGFELKRRGELELIKTFQSQVFERFLDGNSLEECYASVADVANHWIDVLDTQGESLDTEELIDLISENRSMSRQLADYGDQKGTSQTTARRLGEFLGGEIVKDKGLNCKFIISERPFGAPVTERAVPTAIWKAEPAVMKHYLRKWLKEPGMQHDDFDIRNVLDWEYYLDRFGKTIQKIITIPAALQKIENPVPRIPHPEWLHSKVRQLNDRFQQKSIRSMFQVKPKKDAPVASIGDIEDFGRVSNTQQRRPIVHRSKRKVAKIQTIETEEPNEKEPEERVVLSRTNFADWLKQRKTHWRATRRDRKRTKLSSSRQEDAGGDQESSGTGRRPVSLEGYIRDAAMVLREREWHVIEMREMTSAEGGSRTKSSGQFTLWVMIGKDTLQRVSLAVPRIVYVTSASGLVETSAEVTVRKVDRHLPHNKPASFLYEITMPEYLYRSNTWVKRLQAVNTDTDVAEVLEKIYESSSPLMLRALTQLGCILKAGQADGSDKLRKTFDLADLKRVDRPLEGDYLNDTLRCKRIFVYNGVNGRTGTGIVAVFSIKSDQDESEDGMELDGESDGDTKTQFSTVCSLWVVKSGGRRGQKNATKKQCENLFAQLLSTICQMSTEATEDGQHSEYSAVSPDSSCTVEALNFVDQEKEALSEASESISSYSKSNNGPTILLVNSARPTRQLRRSVQSFTSHPVVTMPFPPGSAHNPSTMNLPALNWEHPAVQLAMEAYFYMVAVSYPKRIGYSRYGNIPIGNLGVDESITVYDVGLSRQLEHSRSLSWASQTPGKPDLGASIVASPDDEGSVVGGSEPLSFNQEDIWGDEDDLVSPVIRRPGSYRCVCVEIDVHDLVIAALTDTSFCEAGTAVVKDRNLTSSPNNVALFESSNGSSTKVSCPVGDEMATSVSLSLLRVMVNSWLRDAFSANSEVADDMLHHVYKLLSSHDALLCDPSLHRAIHSIMKTTFLRMLGELQRLGCVIILGSFHKILVATNKATLGEAEEYVEFVISTIKNKYKVDGVSSGGLGRIALQASRYYTQMLFFDEYNFGGVELERRQVKDSTDADVVLEEDADGNPVVPVASSVISAWSMRNYLGSEIAQEYFRAIIARYSKDVLRKQLQLTNRQLKMGSNNELREQLLEYKRKMVSKHFSAYLTRAVGDIQKEDSSNLNIQNLPGSRVNLQNPALEFVKSVVKILELDGELQREVHVLKRSLLAQIGVPEYSTVAKWENPATTFILPDLFCSGCHESRDINLCDLPPIVGGAPLPKRHWACEDCGTPYDVEDIERRLINVATRQVIRYQMQDLRCTKTCRISTKAMSRDSDCSATLRPDQTKGEAKARIELIHDLASYHELDWLQETTSGILWSFQEDAATQQQ